MIKRIVGIATLFLVIFVIAIGITKANPTKDCPFNPGPPTFAPVPPGTPLEGPFQMKPAVATPAARPSFQQPDMYPDLATTPRPAPQRQPEPPTFSTPNPDKSGGGGVPFLPAGELKPDCSPV